MKLYSTGGKYAAPKKSKRSAKGVNLAADAALKNTTKSATFENTAPAPVNGDADVAYKSQGDLENKRVERRKAALKVQENRKILITACVIFCSIMAATFGYLLIRSVVAKSNFHQLADQVHQAEANLATQPTLPTTESGGNVEVGEQDPTPSETMPESKVMLEKYAGLYEQNSDLFGWLSIDGTPIDYPVMLSLEDNEKYLYSNFEGKYSFAGVPFAENVCTSESDNILIYGHNLKDGTMFRSLLKYERKAFLKKHPTIMFSDLYGEYEYEVMSVFYDRVYNRNENVFKFYQFLDVDTEEEFDYAASQLKQKSIHDTGVNAEYGDQLITLVTCAYHVDNGRFVVVARRK